MGTRCLAGCMRSCIWCRDVEDVEVDELSATDPLRRNPVRGLGELAVEDRGSAESGARS
jgi:hypothetical protein